MNIIARARNKLAIEISKRIMAKEFYIISNDCWGGGIYRRLEMPYLSPTVGLWIDPKD